MPSAKHWFWAWPANKKGSRVCPDKGALEMRYDLYQASAESRIWLSTYGRMPPER